MNSIPPLSTQPPAPTQPNEDVLDMMRKALNGRVSLLVDVPQILSRMDDATLQQLPVHEQKKLFQRMADLDAEEMLEHAGRYINKPYGDEILRKAITNDPEKALRIVATGNHYYSEKIKNTLIQVKGEEYVEENMARVRTSRSAVGRLLDAVM
jgi:hypothetical protein